MRASLLVTTAAAALLAAASLANAQTAGGEQPNQHGAPQGAAAPKAAEPKAAPRAAPAPAHAAAPMAAPGGRPAPRQMGAQPMPHPATAMSHEAAPAHPAARQGERQGTVEHKTAARPGTPARMGENRSGAPVHGTPSHAVHPATATGPGATAHRPAGMRPQQAAVSHGGTAVHLSQEQRTRIHTAFSHEHFHRIDHASFSISVGVAIPSGVEYYPLPPAIVQIVPEYSGYDYLVVGDELLIIDPASLQIVAVLPV